MISDGRPDTSTDVREAKRTYSSERYIQPLVYKALNQVLRGRPEDCYGKLASRIGRGRPDDCFCYGKLASRIDRAELFWS